MTDTEAKVRDHIVEMGVAGDLMRGRSIEEQIAGIEEELKERKERWKTQPRGSLERKMNEKSILALVNHRKKLTHEFDYVIGALLCDVNQERYCSVTKEQIARARAYPIKDLIEVNRAGKARCISGEHADNHPSMDTRNNHCFCYACHWGGDSIAVHMKLHGTTFTEAVKALQ